MKEHITILKVKDFLEDFKQNSETIILEEGKEKSELLAIAKARGIDIKHNRSLGFFKTIYAFPDEANNNGARLPKEKLLKALPSMIGRPVNIDHIRNYVVGHLIDYRFKEKENMVIAYGAVYKANFKDEWDKLKALFKGKKLTVSYEMWCPKNKYKYLEDDTYELTEQEIAGMGIMFRETPAFADARVLEIAKQSIDEQPADLVFASTKKYRRIDSAEDEKIEVEIKKVEDKEITKTAEEFNKNLKEDLEQPPVVDKIKCSNCGEEQIKSEIEPIKCSKCFAILDRSGQMIFIPQIIDFKIGCPSCQVQNWRLLSKSKDIAKVKCLSCAKEYEMKFDTQKEDDRAKIISRIAFVYTRKVTCHQCGKSLPIVSTSNLKNKVLKCDRCGLTFNYDISNQDRYKQIAEINEIISSKDSTDKIEKSSEGGQEKMKIKLEVSKFHRYTDDYGSFQKAMWAIDTVEKAKDDKATKLKYKERKALPDSMFAVALRVKNKKTGKIEKIRMYPIQDEAHVTEALARLKEVKPKTVLQKLGVDIEKVKAKILRRAKQLKKDADNIDTSAFPKEVTTMVKKFVKTGDKPTVAVKKAWKEYKKAHPEKASEGKSKESELPADMQYEATFDKKKETPVEKASDKYRSTIRKAVRKIIDLKKEATLEKASVSNKEIALKAGVRKVVRKLMDVKKASKKKVKFYQDNANTICERREELGEEFASELTDEDILNDDKFTGLKAEKENVELRADMETASSKESGDGVIGSKSALKKVDSYAKKREAVNEVAFGNIGKKKEK